MGQPDDDIAAPRQPLLQNQLQPNYVYQQQAPPQPVVYQQGPYQQAPPAANYIYLQPGQQPPAGAPVVYVAQGGVPQPQQYNAPMQQPSGIVYLARSPELYGSDRDQGYHTIAIISFMLYWLSFLGFWPVQIISISFSLHMTKKRVIEPNHRALVIFFSIIELIGWVFLPSFVWFTECYRVYYSWGGSSERCDWWGWIAVVVWYATLLIALPRAIFTYKARNNAAAPGCCTH